MARIGKRIEEINEPEPVPITIPEQFPESVPEKQPVIEPVPVTPEPVKVPVHN